jgi:hypothetical protein
MRGGRLTLAVVCQASRDMGGAVSRQHLCFIGFASAYALADLLSTALFCSFAILRRNALRLQNGQRGAPGVRLRLVRSAYTNCIEEPLTGRPLREQHITTNYGPIRLLGEN